MSRQPSSPARRRSCGPSPALALALALVLAPALRASALPIGRSTPQPIVDALDTRPPALRGVDVEERLGEPLPLRLRFSDEAGREVTLGDVLPRTKPVLLTLVYYNCPQLCNLVLTGQQRGLREQDLELGRDFEAVTVSIDPKDTPAQSLQRRRRHLQALGLPESAPWHFLTGSEESIQMLADALGFRFNYDRSTEQYAHPAVVHVVSPEGAISRYLYGTTFAGRDLKLALLEAAAGRVGTTLDRVVLSCFKYDAASRRYGFYIFGFIRLGGLLIFASVASLLVVLWRRELKKGRAS